MQFRPKLQKNPRLKGMGRLEEPCFWWKIGKYVEVGIYGVFHPGDRSEYLDIRRTKAFEQVKKSTPTLGQPLEWTLLPCVYRLHRTRLAGLTARLERTTVNASGRPEYLPKDVLLLVARISLFWLITKKQLVLVDIRRSSRTFLRQRST